MTEPEELDERLERAYSYAQGLQNRAKRRYALAYLNQTTRNGLAEPDRGTLSFMAAQAVRMRIREIIAGQAG